jgi:putative ABC transport system permease protein
VRTLHYALQTAIRNVFEQGSRTWLSSLGVMVGSVAILLLVSIAKGVQSDVTREVRDIGVNVLVVLPGKVEDGNFNPNLGGQSFLKEEDAARVRQVPGVVRATTLTFAGGGVKAGDKEAYPVTIAADHEWFAMHPTQIAEGRVLEPRDANEPVAVLGGVAKKALFGDDSSLDKKIDINGVIYRVIGATKEKGSGSSLFSMFGFQNVVYIPRAVVKKQNPTMQIDRIMIQTSPTTPPKELRAAVSAALSQRLNDQQYSVLTEEDLLGLVYRLMSILTWLVTGLTSIAIFVGGIGVLTVMMMAVSERAREIGIRKTTGATNRDIFWQFLFEGLAITTLGGMVGLVISLIVAEGLRRLTPIKPMFTPDVLFLAFGVCLGVGCIFGLIPALNAARKDPIISLRFE